MARLLVQLKLRLLANALRSSNRARASFMTSTAFAVLTALGMFALLASLHGQSTAVVLTSVMFTVLAFGWLILPLLAFGLDGTLDPATMALYPLRTRPLATGLLAASATGAWPAANVMGLLGVVIGLARGVLGVLAALVAVLLQVLFCITLARFVTTSMAGLLRSRRGKDLAVFLFIPIIAGYEFFTQVVPRLAATGKLTTTSFSGSDAWLRWLPPGLAAHAIQDASDGRPLAALLRLALLAAVIAVLGWLWIQSLSRALVSPDSSSQPSRVRGPGGRPGLAGRARTALPFARYGLRGAVAARFWIYQRREPISLVYWGMTAVITAAASAGAIIGPQRHPGVTFLSAVLGAAFIGLFHANTVGSAGPSFVIEATALTGRNALRAYLSGQNIVLAVIGIPLLIALTFGLGAAAGSPAFGFEAMPVALAALGAALALSNIITVTGAYPMVRRIGTPIYGAAPGYGSSRVAATFGTLLGIPALVSPVIVAAVLTAGAPLAVRAPLLTIGAAAYGLALAWAGVGIAAATGEGKMPELCQVALASKV
jgi:ABC-2 type transport system permease protein